MTIQECYEKLGGDYAGVMRRLMTEDRVKRFLGKLVEDPCFADLDRALESGSVEDAFRAAHTIKGVCMNLGVNPLADCASDLTENLRGGQMDGNTPALAERLHRCYGETAACVRELMEG